MKMNFKETNIPDDFTKAMAKDSLIIGPANADKIATTMMRGVSSLLAKVKNTQIPKAAVFRTVDNVFLAMAKVEFIPNGDDPSAGRWDYTWSFYEDDLKDCDTIEINTSSMVSPYFTKAGHELYNMRFASDEVAVHMVVAMVEMIIAWLRENANENESTEMVLNDAFVATSAVENGEVVMGIVPAGCMKVMIKDDSAIQEN